MKTDETPGNYVVGASEVEDSTNNAIAMLGTGYDQPTVIIEPPRTVTGRQNGRMVEIEEPAWVKFSTEFKKELVSLGVYSLKVFLYIGLSVNWKTGEAYPGVRLIAEETGMDKGTVVDAVSNLEDLGFLTIQRREGNSNIYTPTRYISIGTVRPYRTPQAELSGENAELSGDQEGNLHNKKELELKKEGANAPLSSTQIQEIVREANQSFDAMLNFEAAVLAKQIEGKAWRGRELCPPQYLAYGDWWHLKTGLHMYGQREKQKLNAEWTSAFKAWYGNEISFDALEKAFEANKWRGAISKPSIITSDAKAIQALPEVKDRQQADRQSIPEHQGISRDEAMARGLITPPRLGVKA